MTNCPSDLYRQHQTRPLLNSEVRRYVVHQGNVSAAAAEACSGTVGIAVADTVVLALCLVYTCLDDCMMGVAAAAAAAGRDTAAGSVEDDIGAAGAAGAAAGTVGSGTAGDASQD